MINLKYSEGYKDSKKRLGSGFYILIALCLLIIGGAAWFALSNMNEENNPPINNDNNISSEYKDNSSSYTETVPEESSTPITSKITETEVEKEPYNTQSAATSENSVEKISFTMPTEGEILTDYNIGSLQYSKTYGDMRFHNGIDIKCAVGSPIYACSNGKVKSIENNNELGCIVTIEHPNNITVKYASVNEVTLQPNDEVKMGDIIGVSTTIPCECNDEAHIHIEAYINGKQISPLKAFGLEN